MCLAIPALVLSVSGDEPITRTGRVSSGGVTREVSLAFVPEAKVGDYVVLHAGCAINTLARAEANRVFEYLSGMTEPKAKGSKRKT